jgi:nitrate reductase beta subunit
MGKFNHGKWIKQYKEALVEKKKEEKEEYKGHKPDPADDNIKKKGQSVHSKDLLHTTKVDGKKADKVDMKIGAENDLAIEKDKDGMDVYAGGLREAFTPGDMYSNDFDYIGMLRYSAEMVIPEDLMQFAQDDFVQTLNDLFESYTDVNYHSEARDLGIAIDWIEDARGRDDVQKMRMELEKAQDYLESHQKAAAKTLKDLTKGKM